MGGEGSGGKRLGAGKKRQRIIIKPGMRLSLSRVSNDGRRVSPAVSAEVIQVGGENGHDRQFVIVTDQETITVFVDAFPASLAGVGWRAPRVKRTTRP